MSSTFRITSRKGIRQLSGKVAVVTGAASGIGRALALGLWEKGCQLALVDLDQDGLARLNVELSGIRSRSNRDHTRRECRRRERACAKSPARLSRRTARFICSSTTPASRHEAAFPQTSLDDWDRIVGVNLWGVIHGCHFFMPHLAKVDRAPHREPLQPVRHRRDAWSNRVTARPSSPCAVSRSRSRRSFARRPSASPSCIPVRWRPTS